MLKTQELFRPSNLKLPFDSFYTNLVLSAEWCKCERINKQATLIHKQSNTAVKWNAKE